MRLHQLELHFETDPALALRQFHKQIGQGDVGPKPRHKALTAVSFWLDHSVRGRCERPQVELAERARTLRILGLPLGTAMTLLNIISVFAIEDCP